MASAGHPPPVLHHPGHSLSSMAVTPGPPLGIGAVPGRYPVTNVRLSTSDVLAFYTDGLIDVGHKSAGVRMERLGRALAESGTQPSDQIAEGIMSTLTEVDQRIDDGALLVVKFATP